MKQKGKMKQESEQGEIMAQRFTGMSRMRLKEEKKYVCLMQSGCLTDTAFCSFGLSFLINLSEKVLTSDVALFSKYNLHRVKSFCGSVRTKSTPGLQQESVL